MQNGHQCNLCNNHDSLDSQSETATIRSNVRKFQEERFTVWRCGSCRSIHARDDVDLARYYADYPFHNQVSSWVLRAVYRSFRVRLGRAGLRRKNRILDYGCGSGSLVKYFRSKGYEHVQGYDAYSEIFNDPAALEQRYDFLIAQDLVEHVDNPRRLLETFNELVKPGGVVLIGTPNADAIDLAHPDQFVHTLHQPYHTHIFSKDALLCAGSDMGWSLDRLYMTQYVNTPIPCINTNFGLHYVRCFDNNIDLAFEPVRFNRKLLLSPRTGYLALFGYFGAPETDITAVFRTATL